MTPRERVRKTLTFDRPDRIPRQVWILPWAERSYPDDVVSLKNRFPDDIAQAPVEYRNSIGTIGDRYKVGTYIDEWGCVFENIHDGIIGIVQKPLIADWDDLDRFRTPDRVLSLDRKHVDTFCKNTDCFVIAGTVVRPFERLQFIRTMTQALIDLAEQPTELFTLLDHIHRHYLREVEMWASTRVDAINLMDDWGTQNSLITSPEIFRTIFKPMYREYVAIARRYDKYVFMHSDGYITEIIPDLIEIGIDALNSQIFCMGVRELGDRFRGRLTFWGEIDRQTLLPRGTCKEICEAVKEVYEAMYDSGGVIAQCEFGPGAKPENVFAVFETWNTLMTS